MPVFLKNSNQFQIIWDNIYMILEDNKVYDLGHMAIYKKFIDMDCLRD